MSSFSEVKKQTILYADRQSLCRCTLPFPRFATPEVLHDDFHSELSYCEHTDKLFYVYRNTKRCICFAGSDTGDNRILFRDCEDTPLPCALTLRSVQNELQLFYLAFDRTAGHWGLYMLLPQKELQGTAIASGFLCRPDYQIHQIGDSLLAVLLDGSRTAYYVSTNPHAFTPYVPLDRKDYEQLLEERKDAEITYRFLLRAQRETLEESSALLSSLEETYRQSFSCNTASK